MKQIYALAILASVAALSGCAKNDGKWTDGRELAKASGAYAQCVLEKGAQCTMPAPPGASVEKTSVAAADDAIRINARLEDSAECAKFARKAVSRWYGYMTQAVVNGIVVAAYNVPMPVEEGIQQACRIEASPYKVSLTMTKAL